MRTFGLTAFSLVLAPACLSLGVSACVQKTTEAPAAATSRLDASVEVAPATKPSSPDAAVIRTVKPGAAVQFAHSLRYPIKAGETGTVDLRVSEPYAEGTLILQASGDDGLSVFGAGTSARFDMAGSDSHAWTITFEAEQDGVHYLNIQAIAQRPGQTDLARAYGVRVEVGDFAALATKPSSVQVETLPSGETAVILEADETIDP